MSILIFGEIVWDDITPHGGSGKPEHIGGAPLNVAAHCAKFGLPVDICSALGRDELGERALANTKKMGIGTHLICRTPEPTCLIKVTFGSDGEPCYHIPMDVSWDHIKLSPEQRHSVGDSSCFYFGTLALRSSQSRYTVEQIVHTVHFNRVLCDLNLREPFYTGETIRFCLQNSTIAKLNAEELCIVSKLFRLEGKTLEERMRCVIRFFSLSQLVVTLGSQGAAYLDGETFGQVPGIPIRVADPVGAGDGFSAGLLISLEAGTSLHDACVLGNQLGAFIAGQTSSIPPYSRATFEHWRCDYV